MKRNVILAFLISVIVASLSGCILSSTPTTSAVTLKVDAQQTFAVTGFLNGAYVWFKNTDGTDEVIADATGASYDYTALAADKGTFVLKVQTTDLLSQQVLVKQWTVTVTQNLPPIAEAGTYPDYNLVAGGVVQLDGSGSSDQDSVDLSYHWILEDKPEGSAAALTNAFSVNPTFTPDLAGPYQIRLIVSDGENTVADTAVVNAYMGNRVPTANAGADAEISWGAAAQLDGSDSSDPDDDTLTYTWRIIENPVGSNPTLSATDIVNPVFSTDLPGTYKVGLIVNDGEFPSAEDEVIITVTNLAPIANAGDDAVVDLVAGETYTLQGSGADPDGNPIVSYTWMITFAPAGSTAALSATDIANPTFKPDVKGEYRFSLVVSDGNLSSNADEMILTTSKHAPVAEANDSIRIKFGNSVNLTGALSTDPDGDDLSYAWSVTERPDGSSAEITNADQMNANFQPDVTGIYTIQLTVSDGVYSSSDTMQITVNNAPIANAGGDVTSHWGSVVQLDGSLSSDADNDTLTYQWTLETHPTESTAAIIGATDQKPTFQPDVTGEYTISLVVNDGLEDSKPVTIKITSYNSAPTAEAGDAQNIFFGGSAVAFQLNGSGTDPDEGTTLTYAWTLTAPTGSAAVLDDATLPNPTFTMDVVGMYTCQLVVSDGNLTATDTVVITFYNDTPIANAGPDQPTCYVNSLVTLAGSGSDPEGQTLNYTWSIVSVPSGSAVSALTNPYSQTPTFTPDKKGQYIFSLVVDDGVVYSAADTVTITVGNRAPTANAGTDISNIAYNGTVTLNGSASYDLDGDTLYYTWTQTGGTTVTLNAANTAAPYFTVTSPGTYTFSLVVSDGTTSSATDTVVATTASFVANTEGWESGSANWTITKTGSWSSNTGVSTGAKHSGSYSYFAQSASMSAGSKELKLTRTINAYVSTISWWLMAPTAGIVGNLDITLWVNGVEVSEPRLSSKNTWTSFSYSPNTYVSTIAFTFTNFSSVITYTDACYIDDIVWNAWN